MTNLQAAIGLTFLLFAVTIFLLSRAANKKFDARYKSREEMIGLMKSGNLPRRDWVTLLRFLIYVVVAVVSAGILMSFTFMYFALK